MRSRRAFRSTCPGMSLRPSNRRVIIDGEGRFPGVRGFFRAPRTQEIQAARARFSQPLSWVFRVLDVRRARGCAPEARQVKIDGKNICQVCSMTVEEARAFFDETRTHARRRQTIAERLLNELRERLRFLNDVGLEYLTLDRLASTLSGGEAQRIQLATSLGSRLVGTLYVLDEPSIGLHSRDTSPADQDPARAARPGKHDPGGGARSRHHARRRPHLDLGPGAGESGGTMIGAAPMMRFAQCRNR